MKFPYKATIAVLICVCVILGIYSAYETMFGGVKKQIAVLGTIEETVDTKGYILRDEMVVQEDSGTVIDSHISDGERVAKGQLVASVYSSAVDPEVKAKLKSLNERIISLEKSAVHNKIIGNDSVKSEALVRAKREEIIKYAHLGQAGKLSEVKSELETVIDGKLDDSQSESVLEGLKKQKQDLESSISGEKNAIYAPESGMYFSFLDGGEKVLLTQKIESMTVSDFENINPSAFEEKTYSGAKIVRDFKWYYVTVMPSKKAIALKKDSTVKLRFSGNGDKEVKASVFYISEDENDKTLVAFEAYTYDNFSYANRYTDVEVVLSSASGLKFFKDAVRVEDSITGVYVVLDSVARFRQVDILASDDKYVVVKDNTEYKSVSLYDEVVVKGDVTNNKIVK